MDTNPLHGDETDPMRDRTWFNMGQSLLPACPVGATSVKGLFCVKDSDPASKSRSIVQVNFKQKLRPSPL